MLFLILPCWNDTQLLERTQHVWDIPELDEVSTRKTMYFNPCYHEGFSGRRDVCKLTLVSSAHHVARDYKIIFGYLILDGDLQIWKGGEIG